MDKEIQTTEEGETIGTNNDARLKMLQQINDANDATLAEGGDLADVNDDGTTSTFGKPETLTDEEVTQKELDRAAEEASQGSDEAEQTEQPKHKIKVNGKELELTTEELVQRAQKVESADEYLKEASRKMREAESAKEVKPTLPSPEDATAKAMEDRRALVRAIQMGTEDEAMEAIEKLQSRNVPSVSADDVARTVDERLTFNDAVSRFQKDYKDLAEDPVLLNIVLQRDKELIAQGDKRSYWERYVDIGDSVRTWKEGLTKAATPEPEKPVSDKQTRKASAPAVPQGAGTKAPAAVQDEDREETSAEIISKMAKSRGGPQWLRG
jgi:hypothetical protein